MISAEDARQHIRYTAWASRRVLDAALELDPEQLHRDVGVANKSIYGTLEHICWADQLWLGRVLGTPVEPPGKMEVEWPRILDRWLQAAENFTDAEVARTISYAHRDGRTYSFSVQQIVMHVVNHATLHRGQVMAMIRQLGIAPPATDLSLYFREQQSTHA